MNPTFGAVTSFNALGGRVLAGVNVQDRYRHKQKRSDRYTDNTKREKASWEDQDEIKDGRDYAGNLSYVADIGSGRLSIDGFYVKTERDVSEVSFEEELDDGETYNLRVPGLDPYRQKNYGVSAEYKFDMAGGTTELSLDHARFENSQATTEGEMVYISGPENWDNTWRIDGAKWDETAFKAESVSAKDAETGFRVHHQRALGATELEFGVDYRTKKRESRLTAWEWDAKKEGETPVFPMDYDLDRSVASVINEKRLDPYLMLSGKG